MGNRNIHPREVFRPPEGEYRYMKLALRLAERAKDRTYPNPMVGAVIVKKGRIIGKGYHHRAGGNHAEVEAIKSVSGTCSGSTMFVTLEPCDHFGRTPPCTQAIIKSGIKAVKIAMKDPNLINAGRGIRQLRNAGIQVNVGLFEAEAKTLNRKYIKFITTGLPYVTVKLAESLDGKIAAQDGSSKWISSQASRKHVRNLRSNFDAIIIGSKTLSKDNPFLLSDKKSSYNTARVIVDTCLKTPLNSNIIKTRASSPVIVAATELAPESKIKKISQIKGIELIMIKSRKGKVPLKTLFWRLGQKGIVNVLVEGGGGLVGGLLDEGLIDEVMFFIAPKIIGGSFSSIKGKGVRSIKEAFELADVEVKRFGEDIFVRGVVKA